MRLPTLGELKLTDAEKVVREGASNPSFQLESIRGGNIFTRRTDQLYMALAFGKACGTPLSKDPRPRARCTGRLGSTASGDRRARRMHGLCGAHRPVVIGQFVLDTRDVTGTLLGRLAI